MSRKEYILVLGSLRIPLGAPRMSMLMRGMPLPRILNNGYCTRLTPVRRFLRLAVR